MTIYRSENDENHIDCYSDDLFLHVEKVKMERTYQYYRELGVGELCKHIVKNHHSYIREGLERIYDHLRVANKIDHIKNPEIAAVFSDFSSLKEHFESLLHKKEEMLFPLAISLLKGKKQRHKLNGEMNAFIEEIASSSEKIKKWLLGIRSLTRNYTPPAESSPTLKLSYAELFNFEQDLNKQFFIEKEILFPKLSFLQKKANLHQHKMLPMKGIQKILVPTDFSSPSENALDYAVELASATRASLILMHAYHVPPSSHPGNADLEKENSSSEQRLKKTSLQISKHGTQTEYVIRAGFATEEIPTLAKEKKADLIVMGMRGMNRLEEIVIGSNTTTTIRKSLCPVLIVPEKTKFRLPRRIAFACDFHEISPSVLETVRELTKTFRARLYILNLVKPGEHGDEEKAVKGIWMEDYLQDTEHLFFYQEQETNLTDEINTFILKHEIDILIMVPHKHTLIDRIFSKSHTKEMAFHTSVPMLAIPEKHKSVPIYFL